MSRDGVEATIVVTEQERMDGKLERLLRRNEKVFFEIMKSKISKKSKIEMYDTYGCFMSGFFVHLEEKYPYLKEELAKKKNRSWGHPGNPMKHQEEDEDASSTSKQENSGRIH